MTLDPLARQVRQLVTVAPSPANSGTDFHIDFATTYQLNGFEQTVPFKIIVYPVGEEPTKSNYEVILVQAFTPSTRAGSITLTEVQKGNNAKGSAAISRVQAGSPDVPQSEIQTVTLTGTGGTFTLTFNGQTTSALAWNASAATVQTALQALSSIGAGNATVTGSAGGPWTVTFAGALANTVLPLMTSDGSLLTTAGAGTATVSELTHGAIGVNEVQQIVVNAASGTFTITFGGQTTVPLPWNVPASTMQTELQALSSIGSGNIAVAVTSTGTYQLTFQGALAGAAQALVTTDPTLLAMTGQNEVWSLALDADAGSFQLSVDGGVNWTGAQGVGISAASLQANIQGLAAVGANNCVVTYAPESNSYIITFVGSLASTPITLTTDASSLTVTTAHVTSSLRAQDGTNPRTILVGDIAEVALSGQQSNNAIATQITAGKLLLAPYAHELQSGATLKLDAVAVADPSVSPSVSAAGTGTGFHIPPFPSTLKRSFAYTWIDGSGHETALSPQTNINWTDPDGIGFDTDITVTLPAIPSGATGFNIYMNSGTSVPAHVQSVPTYASSSTVSPVTMHGYDSSGAAPPGSSTFGGTSPAQILDNTGAVILSADGNHALISKSVLTTKGDLLVASGAAAPARLGVGTDGYVLTADSSKPNGVAWEAVPGGSGGVTTYRKTTTKTVVSSVTETDLLNGEITLAAGILGTTGRAEGDAAGDYLQNSGAVQNGYRFKLKLGGTVLIDTGAPATALANGATRWAWQARWTISNLGATNSQYITFWLEMTMTSAAASTFQSTTPTTGSGRTSGRIAVGASNNLAIESLINNTAAVDTTVACPLVLSVILPTSSASVDCALANSLTKIF